MLMQLVDFLPAGLNSVQLIGYTGADPLKGAMDHQPTKFSLATTQYYQSREGKKLTAHYQPSLNSFTAHCT